MQQRSLLAISYAFPPLPSPRSVQVSRLLANLNAKSSVICAEEIGGPTDPSIDTIDTGRVERCIRVPFSQWRPQGALETVSYHISRPVWSLQNTLPDQYRNWARPVIRAVGEL